ncbi:MAG: holo-ACP synthase [Rickettsiales bacterium]|nr:holo-ACP synthase [Rickettsiales bacterium]
MMIGTGHDMTDIRRIEKSLARFGERFENRVFTPTEQAKAQRRKGGGERNGLASTYAKRFAAKEACAKALGTGFREGVFHKDMGVVNLPSGKPTLELSGGALAKLNQLVDMRRYKPVIHLTLSDEYPYAQAHVIIEAVPVS